MNNKSIIYSSLYNTCKLSGSAPLINYEYTQKYAYPDSFPAVVKQYFYSAIQKKNIINEFNNKSVIYICDLTKLKMRFT